MKAIGKIAVLAMTMALALVLTACGGSSSGSASSASGSASASGSDSAASASASSDASASASSSAASADFVKGTISGDTYTSEFFGVKYTLPEGFAFYGEDQMTQLNGDVKTEEQAVEALKAGKEYFDAAAGAAEGFPTVTVSTVYAGTPEAQALDAAGFAKYQAELVQGELGTYTSNETGAEFPAIKRTLEINGQKYVQELVFAKQGDYFMVVTATSTDDSGLDETLCKIGLIN